MNQQQKFHTRLDDLCADTALPWVSISAGNADQETVSATWKRGARVPCGNPCLVASITKPVVAMAAMRLIAEGRLLLNDRAADWLPIFDQAGLRGITVRHLLTHTCGLPDMLPENQELRAAHATLREFVEAAAACRPEFPPGSDCRYSSMGFAVLGRILEGVTGVSLQEYLSTIFFIPLQMTSTWLGLSESQADRLGDTVLPCELPVWQEDSNTWNWNSRYWRTLGAPWGGLISTATDLGRYARMMLRQGMSADGVAVLPSAAVRASTCCQTSEIQSLPESVQRLQKWGFGWRWNWPGHPACLCELLPASTYGHWGATGTLMWISPQINSWAVLLTTVPYERSQRPLQRLSNLIAAALTER